MDRPVKEGLYWFTGYTDGYGHDRKVIKLALAQLGYERSYNNGSDIFVVTHAIDLSNSINIYPGVSSLIKDWHGKWEIFNNPLFRSAQPSQDNLYDDKGRGEAFQQGYQMAKEEQRGEV